jgi:hypothetical protein
MAASKGQSPNQLPYPPAKVLWPLVGAMNLLASRSQRTQQIERDYQRLQQAIASYARIIQKDGHASLPRFQTGTLLDQLIMAAQAPGSQERQQSFSNPEQPPSGNLPGRSLHGENSSEWFF